MPFFPRQRKITVCTSCGDRMMSISDDGGDTWTCNRCTVAYGIGREKLYDDPSIQKTVANHPVYGDRAESIQAEPEKNVEVKPDDKPRKGKRKATTEKTN